MYKLEPLKNWKLYTTIFIILRNTITSKATLGLINASNSEIVTVLNP